MCAVIAFENSPTRWFTHTRSCRPSSWRSLYNATALVPHLQCAGESAALTRPVLPHQPSYGRRQRVSCSGALMQFQEGCSHSLSLELRVDAATARPSERLQMQHTANSGGSCCGACLLTVDNN